MALDQINKNKAPENEIRMVLIGKTGVGKSKTGNTILGDSGKFAFGCDLQAVTSVCSWNTANRFGKKLDVVDTPGVFDMSNSNFDVQTEISRCITMTLPGPQALLLCVKMGRFTEQDVNTIKHFWQYFGEELVKFTIVVFTQIDQWEDDLREQGRDIPTTETYLKNLPEPLMKFIALCGNRVVFVNNRVSGTEKENQARLIVSTIENLIAATGNKCYTNDNYKKVEKALEDEALKSDKTRDEIKTSSEFFKMATELIRLAIVIIKAL